MSKGTGEAIIQYAIARRLGVKNIVIPNVSFARVSCKISKYKEDGSFSGYEYPFEGIRHEADLLYINENDYLTEVEIKISYSDFLADFQKKEKHLTKYTRAVYYAFPYKIYKENSEKILKILTKKFPEAGVIIVDTEGLVEIIKKTKCFKSERVPLKVKFGLMKIGCQKWWKREAGR